MNASVLSKLISNSKQINQSKIINNHFDGISDLSISTVSQPTLAASSFDTSISIYDLGTQKEMKSLKR